MKSDEPAPHRIGKKNEEGPIYGKRAVRGAERRIRLPALCARLAAGGSDAGPLSRRPCRGGRWLPTRPGDGLSAAERNAELTLPGAQADPCCMGYGGAGIAGGAAGLHPRGARRPEDLSFPRAARADGGGAAGVPRHRVGRREARPASSRRGLSHHGRALLPRRSAILRCAATATAPHCGSGITRRSAAASTIAAPRRKRSTPGLQQLLLAFSQDEYRHANAMLCLLSGVM